MLRIGLFILSILIISGCHRTPAVDVRSNSLRNTLSTDASDEQDVPVSSAEDSTQSKSGPAPDNDEKSFKIIEEGFLSPTIYFFPTVNEDESPCAADSKQKIYGGGGRVLTEVCKNTFELCSEQGSCAVIQNGEKKSYNILGRIAGQERYFEIRKGSCIYGYGVRGYCLDPYYSVAADLTIYKPGDVIYVPAAVGLALPNGSKHNGFFVVRDEGRGIVGKGRFDFFSGEYSWKNPANPFLKIGLGDSKNKMQYFKVGGLHRQSVLRWRSFPGLPRQSK